MNDSVIIDSTDIAAAKAIIGAGPERTPAERRSAGLAVMMDGRLGRDVTADYNEIVVDMRTSLEQRRAQVEMWIAKGIGTAIGRVYPNREWAVRVDCDAGYIAVQCPSVSLTKEYILHLKQSNMHDLQERAVKAAGEILERYGVSRDRRFDVDQLETLERDVRGDVIVKGTSADPDPV